MKEKIGKLSAWTVVVFFAALGFYAALGYVAVSSVASANSLEAERIMSESVSEISEVINALTDKSRELSELIVQTDNEARHFENYAHILFKDTMVLNVLLAPDGVVTQAYPSAENEAAIGIDFFVPGAENPEAVRARETKGIVFSDPFNAVNGEAAIIARYPVYISSEEGAETFWGLLSMSLKYNEITERAGFNYFGDMNLAYEIFLKDGATGEEKVIISGGKAYDKASYSKKDFMEKHLPISSEGWYFRVMPIKRWYTYPITWVTAAISIIFSLAMAYIVQSNYTHSKVKKQLEEMANTDPLLGIYNRRFFMEAAKMHAARSARIGTLSYIAIFDLDHFKYINDEFTHLAGDKVLIDVAEKVKGMLRQYDIFARYGGEEFIILVSDINEPDAKNCIERIRQEIHNMVVEYETQKISVTASFGVSPLNKEINLENSLKFADTALYAAKEAGRNRVVFHEEEGGLNSPALHE
ncbi:MAG: sensor domain-containing diguanylate cyclase [Clostridiales bacterium]|jgi:diguanylate cyclase (GGDEF)-like protein|nr:sensor domain-containing diguanylate cyclase [Clostridiales bacterium]